MLNAEQQERLDQVLARYFQDLDEGRGPNQDALLLANPDLGPELRSFFEDQRRMMNFSTVGVSPSIVDAGNKEAPLAPGTLIGQYRIENIVGRGGMGIIYKATHLQLGNTVAIKVLARHLVEKPQLVQRFHREGRALAKLVHPNIVQVFDMGSLGDVHYIVMEFVEGVNLRQVMQTEEITSERAFEIVPQICAALEYAHDQGVVHRDIKPENILLSVQGVPKIADFGLARLLKTDNDPSLTQSEVVLGTFNYMAPEQKQSASVDHRADIYAVGVMLYEMLTGKLPVGKFPRPSEKAAVDDRIDQVVLKALEVEPSERYQRASDFGNEIHSAILATGGEVGYLEVVNSDTGEVLHQTHANWLRLITTGWADVEVRTWKKNEIGINIAPKFEKLRPENVSMAWLGQEGTAEAILEARLPRREATIFLPEGMPLEVISSDHTITASGMQGALRITGGTGAAVIRDHQGLLEVTRNGDGNIDVEGLASPSFDLRTQAGSISILGLKFNQGKAHLHSEDGEINLGIMEWGCDFDIEAETISGKIELSFVEKISEEGGRVLGRVGQGKGQLKVKTYAGGIKSNIHENVIQEMSIEESAQGIFWVIFIGAIAVIIFGFKWWTISPPTVIISLILIDMASKSSGMKKDKSSDS